MPSNNYLKEEKTCVLIKPDGVKRGLIGEIIKRIEQRGLKIIALEMIWATKDQIDRHYPKDKEYIKNLGEKTLANYKEYHLDAKKELGTDDPIKIGEIVRGWLIDYLTAGPIVKMVISGLHAINMVRKIVGSTMPSQAEMGTIRGDFSVDDSTMANREKRSVRNIIHASGNEEEAKHEINFWFSPEEIHNYKRTEEDVM
ncbi:MAG: Nucleoside diphosphate kinase [Parcubacteria group bacterium ADurb.Bin159]|jgi:nucleoside-diphosphate kinase|nr:MAG: Nucleoside diphosphate kinase [Parcubacteria group bacterium ADurb.Bin159]